MANLDTEYMNVLSLGYVASRIVYTFVYLNNSSNGRLREGVWFFLLELGCVWPCLSVQRGSWGVEG